jgi:hypothetical protein
MDKKRISIFLKLKAKEIGRVILFLGIAISPLWISLLISCWYPILAKRIIGWVFCSIGNITYSRLDNCVIRLD